MKSERDKSIIFKKSSSEHIYSLLKLPNINSKKYLEDLKQRNKQ